MNQPTCATRAYQHLRDKLISGEFAPGSRLRYGPIGKEIGVSATPVREAAGQLANEGLLVLVPQLGAVVRRVDPAEMAELYEVRLALEPYAAGLAADRATDEQLDMIAGHLDTMLELVRRYRASGLDYADRTVMQPIEASDYQFHMDLIAATGNAALVRMASQSHVLTRMFGIHRHRNDATTLLQTCEDHQRIVQAVGRRDRGAASSAVETHIRRGLAQSLAAMDTDPDPIQTPPGA